MHRLSLSSGLLVCAAVAGCGTPAPTDGPDAAPPLPTIQHDYGGTYAVTGSWDLSHPFGGDGVGGTVADLLIDKIIELAGVPGPLEGEAREVIAGAIRQPIVDHVNAEVPAELLTSSPTMMALAAIFSNVEHTGTLSLRPGSDPDVCSGTDNVASLRVHHAASTIDVSMAELLEGPISVAGSISGSATGPDTLVFGQHPLEIRFGALVAIVARDALGVDVYALGDDAMNALDCTALVDVVTGGGPSYDVTVATETFSVPAATLVSACDDLRADLTDDALAMLRPDAGIRLGGPVRLADPDLDRVSDTVTAEPGYGGAITSLPLPFEPAVTATFSAAR